MTKQSCAALATLLMLAAGAADAGSALEVSTIDDIGAGSLREAITMANANPGADLIVFNIPEGSCSAAGVCEIPVLSDLPVITEAVTIDGTTQPRYGTAPENVCARSGVPSHMRVELAGSPGVTHLYLDSAEPSVVRGLSIGGGSTGVAIQSAAAHWVYCNHIGVDAAGMTKKPLSDAVCFSCASGPTAVKPSVLGTDGDNVSDVAERNVIAAASGFGRGINHNADSGFTVAGNYIGLGADGITELNTPECVFFRQTSSDNTYGSNLDGIADENERNILGDCNTGFEIRADSFSFNNTFAGNWIGLNAVGGVVGTQIGLSLIGDTQSVRVTGNRIEGATQAGIVIDDSATVPAGSDDNCIANNALGVEHRGSVVGFDITNNWWGDPSGPSGLGPGSGDGITEMTTGAVDFDPWLTAPPDSCRQRLLHRDGFEGSPLP